MAFPAVAGVANLLSSEQLKRYSRHILLPEIGIEGQRKLLNSQVCLVGAGALSSAAAVYLAAAGVGTLGIIDADAVDITNLHRQILHFNRDIGRLKTESAREHLESLNPDVRVIEHRCFLTSANALEILERYDVIVNGSDNFPTRYLVNDACVLLQKPLVDASILRFEAQMTVFLPGRGCYRCLFPAPPPPGLVPSCAEAGVLGALAGHMGTLQALETIKVLLGIGTPLANRLQIFDALEGTVQTLRWQRNPNCPVCGDNPSIKQLIDYEEFCGVPLPGNASQELEFEWPGHNHGPVGNGSDKRDDSYPPALRQLLERKDPGVDPNEVFELIQQDLVQVIDVREPVEYRQMHIYQAKLIPMGELEHRLGEIDPRRPAVFVCLSGGRSQRVVSALRSAGFDKAYNLEGGMVAWLNSQLPVESGDPS